MSQSDSSALTNGVGKLSLGNKETSTRKRFELNTKFEIAKGFCLFCLSQVHLELVQMSSEQLVSG